VFLQGLEHRKRQGKGNMQGIWKVLFFFGIERDSNPKFLVIDVAEGLYRVSHQSWSKAGKRIVQGVPPKLEQGRKKARQ